MYSSPTTVCCCENRRCWCLMRAVVGLVASPKNTGCCGNGSSLDRRMILTVFPRLTELSVTPVRTTLHAPQRSAILNVTARFSDNSAKDVTTLTVFESSDPSVKISSAGVVEFAESDTSRQTSVTVRYLNYQTTARIEFVPERPAFAFTAPQPANLIDELVFAQLRRLQINPSAVCDDVTFLRRVFLDLTGLLPTPLRARDFLASTDGNKRAEIIDELLASSE